MTDFGCFFFFFFFFLVFNFYPTWSMLNTHFRMASWGSNAYSTWRQYFCYHRGHGYVVTCDLELVDYWSEVRGSLMGTSCLFLSFGIFIPFRTFDTTVTIGKSSRQASISTQQKFYYSSLISYMKAWENIVHFVNTRQHRSGGESKKKKSKSISTRQTFATHWNFHLNYLTVSYSLTG